MTPKRLAIAELLHHGPRQALDVVANVRATEKAIAGLADRDHAITTSDIIALQHVIEPRLEQGLRQEQNWVGGLTLNPVTEEVAELQPFNPVMSKRAAQVERNLAMFEAQWEQAHPGEEPGPVVRARLQAKAWDHERPSKKPSQLGSEAGGCGSWRTPATPQTSPA